MSKNGPSQFLQFKVTIVQQAARNPYHIVLYSTISIINSHLLLNKAVNLHNWGRKIFSHSTNQLVD